MSRVGENIKRLRLKQNMSQKQLGKKLGVAESFINEIENGRKVVNDATIQRLVKIFGEEINELNMYADDNEVESVSKEPVKTKALKAVEVNEVWSDAFSSILKDVPVYEVEMQRPIAYVKMPLVSNKINGHAQDKVFYLKIDNDDMAGFRISKGDKALVHMIHEIENNTFCFLEYDSRRMIRQIKKIDNNKVLLVSNGGSLMTETAQIKDIKPIAKLDRLEIEL